MPSIVDAHDDQKYQLLHPKKCCHHQQLIFLCEELKTRLKELPWITTLASSGMDKRPHHMTKIRNTSGFVITIRNTNMIKHYNTMTSNSNMANFFNMNIKNTMTSTIDMDNINNTRCLNNRQLWIIQTMEAISSIWFFCTKNRIS